MNAEQIAREIVEKVNRCLPPDDLETAFPLLIIVQRDIAAALATARRAGFDAAKEQAIAEVADYAAEIWRHGAIKADPHEAGKQALLEVIPAIRSMELKP